MSSSPSRIGYPVEGTEGAELEVEVLAEVRQIVARRVVSTPQDEASGDLPRTSDGQGVVRVRRVAVDLDGAVDGVLGLDKGVAQRLSVVGHAGGRSDHHETR